MKKLIIYALLFVLPLVLLLSGCTQGNPRFSSKDISDPVLLEKLNGSVGITSEEMLTVKVGQVFHFDLYEKESIPYRWTCHISDSDLVNLIYDIHREDRNSRPLPGGDSGSRWYYFEALNPGECTIEMRYGRIDEEEYSESCAYTVMIVQE